MLNFSFNMNQSSQGNACCPLPAECVNCLGTWLAILTFRDNKSKNCACCWLGCSQVSKIITASNQKQTKQLHALSLTSSMCSCMDARALYPCQMPLPASCTSLRLIHAGLLRFHTAQTRRADRQALLLLILLLIPRGEGGARHSPHPVTLKRCGIPSLLDQGCASGPESVQGTITRQSAPLYLFLSSCPRRGNKRVV